MNLAIITSLSIFFFIEWNEIVRQIILQNPFTNSTGKFDSIQCIHGVKEPIEKFTLVKCTYYHSWLFPFNFTVVITI